MKDRSATHKGRRIPQGHPRASTEGQYCKSCDGVGRCLPFSQSVPATMAERTSKTSSIECIQCISYCFFSKAVDAARCISLWRIESFSAQEPAKCHRLPARPLELSHELYDLEHKTVQDDSSLALSSTAPQSTAFLLPSRTGSA